MKQKKNLIAITLLTVLFGCAAFLHSNTAVPAVEAKSALIPTPMPQASPSLSQNDSNKIGECPAPKPVAIYALCGFISSGESAENQTRDIKFQYEKQLWKMSCAAETLSLEEAKKKIQAMWSKNKDKILCNSSEVDGEKVRLAIHSIQENFPTVIDLHP